MMAWWPACFVLFILDLVAARDIKLTNSTDYVIKKIDSCPDVGYYFRREPALNALYPGPCYLCFCQNNGTAFCWPRETHRCDVEKYHHHRKGRESRVRRSPVSLSDIFFRDATRDFFNRQIPADCKPFESSFSDGCPPVDWCTGCTICDCDANGHWDCHILSFCNGKERKEKVANPRETESVRRSSTKVKPKQTTKVKNTTAKQSKRAFFKKVVQHYVPVRQKINNNQIKITQAPKLKAKQQKNVTNNKTTGNKVTKKKYPKPAPKIKQKPGLSKSQKQPKDKIKKRVKKYIIRKAIKKNIKNKTQLKNQQKANGSNIKVMKRGVSTHNPVSLLDNDIRKVLNSNTSESVKLGQLIVKQVMTSVQKLLKRQMDKINATRIQRSVNGKDCGGVKKIDKSMENVKSKAAAKNKNKFNKKLAAILKKIKHRNKREILNETQAALENITIISLNTENTAVIPLPAVKPQIKLLTTSTRSGIIASSPRYNNYYKYSIKDNIITNEDTNKKNVTKHTTYVPLGSLKFLTSTKDETYAAVQENDFNRTYNSMESNHSRNPDYNDVKFSKWYLIKILQNNTKQTLKKLLPQKIKAERVPIVVNEIIHEPVTPVLNLPVTTKIEKTTTKKNNLENTSTEVANTVNLFKKLVTNYCSTQAESSQNNPNLHVMELPNILHNFLPAVKKKNTKGTHRNTKSGIIKKLRAFFNKIFHKKTNATWNNKYGMGPKEEHTLQVLCENFVNCKIKKKNKFILRYKLKRLNEEAERVLKSIRIIKGLLQLLEMPNDNARDNINQSYKESSLKSFQNDLQKFKTVLKINYDVKKNNENLSETQLFQINYIKKNTQLFIESIKKFALILKEILSIVNGDKNKINYPKKNSNNTIRIRSPLYKIKQLLSRYNLVQNSFISRMYGLIKGIEATNITVKPQTQVSEANITTYNDKVILKYSKSIIDNLRKLKNLAQALSSRRRKRHTIVKRDDALEYLLTLLEFFIKKHSYPLDLSPANDGIDFLIDAIKNAPEIKPIKKKVLEFAPITISSVTIRPKSSSKELVNEVEVTDSENYNVLPKEENRDVSDSMPAKDDVNGTIQSSENDVTAKVFYHNIDDTVTETYNQIASDNTDIGSYKKRREEDKEMVGFDKFESNIIDTKKYGIEDTDDETKLISRPIKVKQSNIIDSKPPLEASYFKNIANASISSETEESDFDSKTKLNWIEATFDKEIKEFSFVNVTDAPISTKATEKTRSKELGLESDDVENIDAYIAKSGDDSSRTPSPEDVMRRKQIEFLHSLDYGTEKPESDDSDSKDDTRADDLFPSYSYV